jgi:transposase
MHVRTVINRPNGKRYTQIVQSYRRSSDGMPATRILANLGTMSDEAVANLKAALEASRAGKSVVLAEEKGLRIKPPKVQDNLRYLDLAVSLALWRQWNLSELIDKSLDPSDDQVRPADVVAALVLQRCVKPGSKLSATRWFPKTALPELLGIAPAQLNNSRIHRVLDALDRNGDKLQSRWAALCSAREGAFATLFMDVTDTWFEGQGPALAEKGRTKEGMFKQRIGIVMLCNEHGYPLRWAVTAGKRPDSQCIGDMLDGIAACGWVGETPMVLDRSMGQASSVHKLIRSGLRFLTMVPVSEINSYTGQHPAFDALATLEVNPGKEAQPDNIQRAAQKAEQLGMECIIKDRRYVLDVGFIEVPTERTEQPAAASEVPRTRQPLTPRSALDFAQQLRSELHAPEALSQAQLGARHGYSRQFVTSLLKLLALPLDVQKAIRAGKADSLALRSILAIAWHREAQKQRTLFDELLRKSRSSPRRTARSTPLPLRRAPKQLDDAETILVQAVLTFNPEICVKERLEADEHLAEIHAFVGELNQKLQSPRSRMTQAGIYRLINGKLERRNLIGVFGVQVRRRGTGSHKSWQVELQFKSRVWATRRSHDGFFLLVADPDLHQSAAELVRLYYAKDKIEKDFQSIKGLVRLRPVRHRTDPKVRAHVTVCMLALLLSRTLQQTLAGTPASTTAETAFEILDNCHLNRLRMPRDTTLLYSITELTAQQRSLLTALRLEHLADDQHVIETIMPR